MQKNLVERYIHMKRLVGIMMEEELIEQLKEIAKKEQRSVSSMVRYLICKCIQDEKDIVGKEDSDTSF